MMRQCWHLLFGHDVIVESGVYVAVGQEWLYKHANGWEPDSMGRCQCGAWINFSRRPMPKGDQDGGER